MTLPRHVGAARSQVASGAADDCELAFALGGRGGNAGTDDGSIGKDERVKFEASGFVTGHLARSVEPVIGGEKIANLTVARCFVHDLAASQAAVAPGKTVLFLVVELCTLSFRRDDWSKSNIVATALFGDGAAAALLSTEGEGPALVAAGEHTWPGSLDVMGWEVADDGLRAIFSRDIPKLVTTRLRDAVSQFLARHGLAIDEIDRFVCHPGGTKVIAALEHAFGLGQGALVEARAVLRDYGNMSAATVMFVLERMLAKARATGARWERALMNALGPGFTAGFLVIDNR